MQSQNDKTRTIVNECTEYVRSMGNANKLAEDLKQKINHVENLMETVEHN